MKTIKIKDIEGNEVAVNLSNEELKRIIKEGEQWLKELEVKGRYFFPKIGERYWYNTGAFCGVVEYEGDVNDRMSVNEGNCYRTREEAELAVCKQKAIVACWKWQQENAPFEPDWENNNQKKWFVYYDYENQKLYTTNNISWKFQFTLPYFKSEKDTENFMKACKGELMLLFTK